MTTIATDGRVMAADGQVQDHTDTIVDTEYRKIFRLDDGRIAGAAGNCFDVVAWVEWLNGGKVGDCPIQSEQFSGLILCHDRSVLWVDFKGRESVSPTPCAVGSGQCFALGAMDAGATPEQAVAIAMKRNTQTGGRIYLECLE